MDEIDRILSSEAGIEPAPEFVRSVMAAVERESCVPPPIPFPWRRIAASAAAIALASTGLAAAPGFRGPAARVITALGAIQGPSADLAVASVAILLVILTGTLLASWRTE